LPRQKAFSRRKLCKKIHPLAVEAARRQEISMSDPMQKFGKEGMDSAMASLGAWSKSAQAIASELADFSKKYFEGSAAAMEKLMAAKSLETAMAVQSEYIKSSYESFVAQSTKISELYTEAAKEAYKPFEGMLGKMPTMK
jgi:hypothetical protein